MPCSIDLIDDETTFLTSDRERDSGFDSIHWTPPDVVEWASGMLDEAATASAPLNDHADTAES
ncbi:hypothetical protein [Haloarcula marismortui]|uniref:Transcriptional regulator n=1 Tax=Haloarcula marismortui ATCC 33800 TaxID=662476 RepID=M0JQL5_9EURY|nr:hypothetical protein [Haloarcula sinaiiensis]EMA10673.1 transcriptional regulator [Haloarcula sinaiiensis ATCC 33800]QUJ74520.1 hypothetical protein KDQ40_19225 [Haloarcula sinaiiensis ATCC 33800]